MIRKATVSGLGTLMILALLAALWAQAATNPADLTDLDIGSLPMTKHAAQAHAGDKYSATNIQTMLNKRFCRPVETYACNPPDNPHLKVICNVGGGYEGLWAGLIVGTKSLRGPVIVTGYAGPREYWQSAILRDNCVPTVFVP